MSWSLTIFITPKSTPIHLTPFQIANVRNEIMAIALSKHLRMSTQISNLRLPQTFRDEESNGEHGYETRVSV